jgi:hypothetical protein
MQQHVRAHRGRSIAKNASGKKARGAELPAALMPKSAVKISAAQSVREDKTNGSSAGKDAV